MKGYALALLIMLFLGCIGAQQTKQEKQVKPGLEVFLEKHLEMVKGKKVGLVTNPTGISSDLESSMELFFNNPNIELVALYGPEHGVRGNAQAGEHVPFYIDEKYGIPVFSLYGGTMKPHPEMFKSIDEYMRSFDTEQDGKVLEENMVEGVDVLIFDMQGVGTRIYTYIATMAYCMQTCAECGIEFVVLDRPNPINGVGVEGPLVEYPKYSSFVGLYPIPVRHGMTIGELADLFNQEFLDRKTDLTVIPIEGWKREMWYDETALPWVMPSPNMPTLGTAMVYPGQVFFEGTNVAEGRGTTRPFEIIGAPWIDGYELAKALNKLKLPGVRFAEVWFTPTFSKYQGEQCGGVQLHIKDRNAYRPFETALHIIRTIMGMYPNDFRFETEYFDKIMGSPDIRRALERGVQVDRIVQSYQKELESFMRVRENYLLYD